MLDCSSLTVLSFSFNNGKWDNIVGDWQSKAVTLGNDISLGLKKKNYNSHKRSKKRDKVLRNHLIG